MRLGLKRLWRRFQVIRASRIRLRGLVALIGLVLLAGGLWAIYPPLAAIAAGAVLIVDAYWRD